MQTRGVGVPDGKTDAGNSYGKANLYADLIHFHAMLRLQPIN